MWAVNLSSMVTAKSMRRQRCCSHLAPIFQDISILGSDSDPTGSQTYDFLLRLCLNQCGKITDRQVFDEMPQRISEAFNAAKVMHAHSLRHGFGLHGQLGNGILDLYAKCGNAGYTKMVFDRLENRDVQAWNSIMSMHMRRTLLSDAIRLFGSMRNLDVIPSDLKHDRSRTEQPS